MELNPPRDPPLQLTKLHASALGPGPNKRLKQQTLDKALASHPATHASRTPADGLQPQLKHRHRERLPPLLIAAACAAFHKGANLKTTAQQKKQDQDPKKPALIAYSNLPSQECDRAQSIALQKGVMTQIPQEGNVAGREINAQAVGLMGASEQTCQAAMGSQQSQPCDLQAVTARYGQVRALLDRPDVKSYIASPAFAEDVKSRMAALPKVHKRIELAMKTYEHDVLHQYAEPSLAEVALTMLQPG